LKLRVITLFERFDDLLAPMPADLLKRIPQEYIERYHHAKA